MKLIAYIYYGYHKHCKIKAVLRKDYKHNGKLMEFSSENAVMDYVKLRNVKHDNIDIHDIETQKCIAKYKLVFNNITGRMYYKKMELSRIQKLKNIWFGH